MVDVVRSNSFAGAAADGTLRSVKAASDSAAGERLPLSPFARMIVLDVIFDPTVVDAPMIDKFKELGISNMMYANSLPRNTIIAQMVADGSAGSVRQPMFLFPMFPHISLPLKPGEHVWVLLYPDLEKKNASLGYWMSRIVEPHSVDDVNHTHSPRAWDASYLKGTVDEYKKDTKLTYDFPNGAIELDSEGTRLVAASTAPFVNSPYSNSDKDAYKDIIQNTNSGIVSPVEPVPRYRKRPGDLSLEGSNNTLIALGTDRSGPAATYSIDTAYDTKVAQFPLTDFPEGAGMIDLVVGRGSTKRTMGPVADNDLKSGTKELAKSLKNDDPDLAEEGDIDLKDDRARIAIFQKTLIDEKLATLTLNGQFDITDSNDGDSAIVVKADKIRLIARKDIELLVTGFEIGPDGVVTELTDVDKMASLVIKTNGEVIIKPSKQGIIRLGSETANKAIVCTKEPATIAAGKVSAAPMATTMAGFIATSTAGQGTYSTKVVIE